MDSYTDSSSNLDEELPFVLIKTPLNVHPTSDRQPIKSSVHCDVMTISSDSDEDVPFVPLALRLQQKQNNGVPASNMADSPKRFIEIVELQHQNCDGNQSLGVKPKASKRTVKEIQRFKEDALKRKQEGEEKQREREAQRMDKEEEKAKRRAMAEAAKALRPEECIKRMVVVVDPALLQLEGGGALLSSLQALSCSCAIEQQPFPRCVSWRRRNPGAQPVHGDSEQERSVVIQMTLEDFISLSYSYIQEERTGRRECGRTLTSWIQELQASHPEKDISLVVIGLEQYFRSIKSQDQKKLREAIVGEEQRGAKRKKGGAVGTLPELRRVEVEEAVVHLQLSTGVCVHFLSTWMDFTKHITMTTKAIAETPFKRERDSSSFSFYLESEWVRGQKVDRAGKGLLQVWKRQIQQLNRVSADMASAVLAAYPAPQLLTQAFRSCRTEKDKLGLLSDIQMRRGEGVTSTLRRVGPELSRRLCVLMTATDPEHTLGS